MIHQKDYRVLSRMGARELTEEEERMVQGAIGTTTKCSGPTVANPQGDGDRGECGHLE